MAAAQEINNLESSVVVQELEFAIAWRVVQELEYLV